MDPPVVYKFMRSDYQDDFLSGRSIRVGTISDFRGFDNPTSRYWKALDTPDGRSLQDPLHHSSPTGGIDDPLEGRTLLHIDRLNSDSEEDQSRVKETHERIGFDAFGGYRGTGLRVKNMIVQMEVPNYFIFCCSNDLSEKTIERMRKDSKAFGGESYDIAIPILDVNGFLNAMTYAVCRKMKIKGKVCNFAAPVEYRESVFSIGDGSIEPPSPLIKHTFFSTQNECRLMIDRQIPTSQKAILLDLKTDTTSMFGTPVEL